MFSGMNCFASSMEAITLFPHVSRTRRSASAAPQSRDPCQRLGRPALWAPALQRTAEAALRYVRGTKSSVLRPAAERVAGLHRALLVAGHEPLLALRGGAMGKGIGHDASRGLALQRVVADRAGRGQRGVDIAGFQEV